MVFVEIFLVLLTWAVSAAVLMGLGSEVLRQFGHSCSPSDAFWMGLPVAVSILQIWHFFMPVDAYVTIGLITLGGIGIIRDRGFFTKLHKSMQSAGFFYCGTYALILTSLAFRALGPCDHFDTGLYGATALRWTLTHHIIPGLVNVHYRLGFNSSVFLCVAALGQGPWQNLGHHLFAGMLVGGFWAKIGPHFVRAFRSSPVTATDCFHSILVVPCVYWTTRAHLVGTMTDLPTTIVCLVAAAILFQQLDLIGSTNSSSLERSPVRIITALTLLALAITFKLSILVFSALASLIGLVLLFLSPSLPKARLRFAGGSITMFSLLVIPWIVRSVVLSGYPFFPSPVFGFPVEWKASAFIPTRVSTEIAAWARTPFIALEQTQGLPWFAQWFHRTILGREAFQVPLVLGTLGFIVALIFYRRGGLDGSWHWLLVPSVGGLLFWFAIAPDPRFGEVAIWTTAATLAVSPIVVFLRFSRSLQSQRVICLAIILASAYCIGPHRLWATVYRPILLSDKLLPLPMASVIQVKTASGLTVFWRVDGLQCWDARIPCTPFFDKSLRLRRDGDISAGFKSNGIKDLSELKATIALPRSLPDLDKRDHGSE
jgi:hypothetical protein